MVSVGSQHATSKAEIINIIQKTEQIVKLITPEMTYNFAGLMLWFFFLLSFGSTNKKTIQCVKKKKKKKIKHFCFKVPIHFYKAHIEQHKTIQKHDSLCLRILFSLFELTPFHGYPFNSLLFLTSFVFYCGMSVQLHSALPLTLLPKLSSFICRTFTKGCRFYIQKLT